MTELAKQLPVAADAEVQELFFAVTREMNRAGVTSATYGLYATHNGRAGELQVQFSWVPKVDA